MLDQHLKKLGFVQSVSDPCIYVASEGEMFMIAVHVDDLVLAAKSDKRIGNVKKALGLKFEVKDMGELHHFLGTKVLQNKQNGDVWIGQPAYAQKVLLKFNMENAKAVDTPVDACSKLVKMNARLRKHGQRAVSISGWKSFVPVNYDTTGYYVCSE